MSEPNRPTRGIQQGPRSIQVVESVRAATLAELSRTGFANLTIDAVAKAAGVSRPTIYRRWPSKAALLQSVVEPLLERYDADPDTGTVTGDLLALMVLIRDNAARPEGRAMITAATTGAAELRELVRAANARTLAPFHRALERAVHRGEVTAESDLPTIAYVIFQAVVMWEPAHDTAPSEADLTRILRTVLPPPNTIERQPVP
ncbi:TetR/AcrR family transcriptional regulator [Actinoplanes sichuanensis]|uniref:TetR/AcrR family transcriptional regulator n=1 Tax=Actinoplanes sichuanensis TaxID=512349 RepID=A0ABW4A2Q3_9ACTN|nr:TetR/AcrR family transcriptional regulator [Actinoplanes sichuanensis]BEL05682.1 TetR/AcrR family transcriptional regulator [Actinoplanes sichuanensis]